MPNINFELNLNKHPKDTPNRSLVAAKNIRVSNDFSCLQNEESIFENDFITNTISGGKIVGVIPCNKEFILFVQYKTDNVSLFRYKESVNNNINDGAYDNPQCKLIYNKFKYNGGKIKGTFTYNIKNHLILAISEYNCPNGEMIPLKTIDVGTWDNDINNTNDTDLALDNSQISLNPEIYIPEIEDFWYENGLAYKGWYSIYIRYKINDNNYTKWYDIGYPILIDELEKVSLFNYFIKSNKQKCVGVNRDGTTMGDLDKVLAGQGVVDYISSPSATCSKTISFRINHNSNNFKNYQIGIICSTKDNQRAFKSLDIDISKTNFLLNFHSLEEYNVNDLIFEKYNYYDVKNVINYKNRLYLSNYKENNITNKNIEVLKDKIKFTIQRRNFNYKFTEEGVDGDIQTSYHNRLKNTTLIPGETYNFYIHFVNKYGEFTEGILMKCIRNGYFDENTNGSVTIHNYSEDRYVDISHTMYIYYLNLVIDESIDCGDYIGFFITYEKLQKTQRFSGILARYDFPYKILPGEATTSQGYWTIENDFEAPDVVFKDAKNINIEPYIYKTNDADKDNKYKFRFYSTDIDVKDNIELNFTKLIIESDEFDQVEVKEYNLDDDTSYDDSGNIDAEGVLRPAELNVISAKYVSAHNFSKNNDYRGSYIELEVDHPELLIDRPNIKNSIYKAILISDNEHLYQSQNKTLIKFTNTYYFDKLLTNNLTIDKGLPGFCTFNTALIYNNRKVILNSGYNILVDKDYKSYIYSSLFLTDEREPDDKVMSMLRYPFVAYYTFIDYNNYPYESRRFKTLPEIISIRSEGIKDDVSQALFSFANATIVKPENSIDLFENKVGSQDDVAIKTYINFVNESISTFDKRVIRSNPIADESFENSWRIFSPEAYKDIAENKGNITNIVAMGTTLLVHTEHSIFMFDRDSTIQSGDGNTIQLSMPDVFDIDYREVFASNLGACGLQDRDAWILDEFGYIFYDNDANRIYNFNSKKIDIIDLSIVQFLNRFKPNKVRFFNDEERNRLLVYIRYSEYNNLYQKDSDKEIMLSYNHVLNKWISEHDYIFNEGFNTKQQLYIINISKTKIFNFNFGDSNYQNNRNARNISYNYFDILDTDKYRCSTLSVIVNDSYEIIKTLEYLTWKLYKIEETQDTQPAREKIRTPYSGVSLRIYNDNVNTDYLDIFVDLNNKNKSVMNYKKPWWQFDNWNLNYFRDLKNAKSQLAKYMSRLYGNYFIIELQLNDATISNANYERIEFETLNCRLINNPTI